MKIVAIFAGLWVVAIAILLPAWSRMRARQRRRDAIEAALLRRQKEQEGEDGER